MKKLSILLSLLALNGCSYFDNIWSCIQHLDINGDGKYDFLEFREYDFTNANVAIFSTRSEGIYTERDGKTDLDNLLYQAFLESDLEDIFKDPFQYQLLEQIEEDSLFIRYQVVASISGMSVAMEPIRKKKPNSNRGNINESQKLPFECKKTRVSGWGMSLHFPDTFNFEL